MAYVKNFGKPFRLDEGDKGLLFHMCNGSNAEILRHSYIKVELLHVHRLEML